MDWNFNNFGPKARTLGSLALLGAGISFLWSAARPVPIPRRDTPSPSTGASAGALTIVDRDGRNLGQCPLKHTDVKAEISGPLARVTVTQDFENQSQEKIEAVYIFPLPDKAAVDEMTMRIGDRTIKGKIKKRDEARKIFEQARQQGHTASLLDQERPNIFTQSVTNIAPGMRVRIEISYVETLVYEAGSNEFQFPMVLGPRYSPHQGVPDVSRITPPVTAKGTRAGHDVSLTANIDAGVPISDVASSTHRIDTNRPTPNRAVVKLKNENEIPNKDFILRYKVAGNKIEDALLTHRGEKGGFFTFLLQPPQRVMTSEVTPKELVFVLDTSGSMDGFPLEKSKEVIKIALDGLYPRDTFNVITFSGDTHVLFPRPVPATPENIRTAQRFLLATEGRGGTEMMKAIRAALDPSDQQDHVRIVCFLTDGYVGNDMEIVDEVKRHPNARVFAFGIGSAVNHFLLDKMSEEGRGEVDYVTLSDDGSAAAKRFHERVRNPLLTDISIDWNGLPVTEVFPKRPADLFSAKPLVVSGRFDGSAKGTIRLRGKVAGREFERAIPVVFPASEPNHEVLASLWARTKVEDLMSEDWTGIQTGHTKDSIRDDITRIGLDFRLLTQFTSFVAVEETFVTEGGPPRLVEVPVEMPHGVSYEGVFGKKDRSEGDAMSPRGMASQSSSFIGGILGNRNAIAPMPVPLPPSQEPKRPETTSSKIDASLEERIQSAGHSVVAIKVWLIDDSSEVIRELKRLGLSVTGRKEGGIVLGKIDSAKIGALTTLDAVLHISRDLGEP